MEDNLIYEVVIELWKILNISSCSLILGLLIASLLGVYSSKLNIAKFLGKDSKFSILKGAFLGAPIPLCSCSVIPVASSIDKEGASKGTTASFLVSSPEIGIDSCLLTYSLLGSSFAYIRLILSLLSAVVSGVLVNIFSRESSKGEEVKKCCNSTHSNTISFFQSFQIYLFEKLIPDIRNSLYLGFFISAILAAVIPDDFTFIKELPYFIELILIGAISVPFYICSLAATPLAGILAAKGVGTGAILVMLLLGPATNIATVTFAKKIFGTKGLVAYLSGIIIISLFGAITVDLLNINIITTKLSIAHNHSDFSLLSFCSTCFLIVLFTYSHFYKKKA